MNGVSRVGISALQVLDEAADRICNFNVFGVVDDLRMISFRCFHQNAIVIDQVEAARALNKFVRVSGTWIFILKSYIFKIRLFRLSIYFIAICILAVLKRYSVKPNQIKHWHVVFQDHCFFLFGCGLGRAVLKLTAQKLLDKQKNSNSEIRNTKRAKFPIPSQWLRFRSIFLRYVRVLLKNVYIKDRHEKKWTFLRQMFFVQVYVDSKKW